MADGEIHKRLQALEHARLIEAAVASPELEYIFRHALVQDAAYDSLLRKDQQALHRAIGEALERLYSDRLDEFAATLAYHFGRGRVSEKSLHYLIRAAQRAQAIYANEEAIFYWRSAEEQVLKLLDHDKKWTQEAAQVYEGLGEVLTHIGQRSEASDMLGKALGFVPPSDRLWQARLQRKVGLTLADRAEKERAYQAAQELLGDPDESSGLLWWQEWIVLQMSLAMLYYYANEVGLMEDVLRRTQPIVEQHGTLAQRGTFTTTYAAMRYRRDRYRMSDDSVRYVHQYLALAEEMHDADKIADAHAEIGFCYLFYGNLDKAEEHMQQALVYAERTGNIWLQAQNMTHLTTVYRQRGDVERVREYAQRAAQAAAQIFFYAAAARANLSWVAWRQGDFDTARREAFGALDDWKGGETLTDFPWQWLARFQLLAIALDNGALNEAADHARAILDPQQHRLPDDINAALEQGSATPAMLDRAVSLAREKGYL